MDNVKIIKYKLDLDKTYTMTKLNEDGTYTFKTIGHLVNEIEVGASVSIGGWYTTPVQEIQMIGKGLLIQTLNSTYLLEELTIDAWAKNEPSKV